MKTLLCFFTVTLFALSSLRAEFIRPTEILCESKKTQQKIQVFPEFGEIVVSNLTTKEEIDFIDNLMTTKLLSQQRHGFLETTLREKDGSTIAILKKISGRFTASFKGDSSFSCI